MGSVSSESVGVFDRGVWGSMAPLSQAAGAPVDNGSVETNRAGSVGTRLCSHQLTDDGRFEADLGGQSRFGTGRRSAFCRRAAHSFGDDGGDLVGIHVGVGATVLEPTFLALATAHGMRMDAPRSDVP